MTEYYLGIDPGASGGYALVSERGELAGLGKVEYLPELLLDQDEVGVVRHAVIEEQQPRPTYFKGKSSILKSTCLLYGHYRELCGMLVASGVPFEKALPKKWQKTLGLENGGRYDQAAWKRVLKQKACDLYPGEKLTLATCDAVLLAHYCKLKWGG